MHSTAMLKLENEIACAIRFDGRVMISGERGTGKKFVAHLIHQRSRRGTAPFVIASRQDFAESPPEPSSGAESVHPFKNGLLKTAQNGTLLIDGLEELSVPMQLQLLQFLESGMTNGSPRLMTTTGADVFECVRSNTVGTDLFYRLNIIRLLIPALRDRPDDIPILFQYYLSCYAKGNIPRLSPGAWQQLLEYAWPGNVQELKAVAEGLSTHDLKRRVEPEDLPSRICQ